MKKAIQINLLVISHPLQSFNVISLAMQSVSQVKSSKKPDIRRFRKAQMKQWLKRKFFNSWKMYEREML